MCLIVRILAVGAVIRGSHAFVGLVVAPEIGATVWNTNVVGVSCELIFRTLGLANSIAVGVSRSVRVVDSISEG